MPEQASKRGPGRPRGSRAWRTYLRATIADRLSKLPGVALRSAVRVAIELTHDMSRDKRHWHEPGEAEMRNVYRAVYRLRKVPGMAIEPSPGLMLQAYRRLAPLK